ncbi:MAG TPA: DUF4157 domain-containing protein [Kofleriaceae bacterium]|nr:DUF4157 domain-containing protein [Kofleriaceae bacterium]
MLAPLRTPGKRTADRDAEVSGEPGKRSRIELGTALMSPAEALRYSDRMLSERALRIDRRAEPGDAEPDDSALAGAFEFLAEVRGGQPLPEALAAQLGAELGIDLAGVRVHTDDRAAQAAVALRARAFTIGDDIYFAAGAYDPTSEGGIELIAHEIAHIGQQRRSVSPNDHAVSRPGDSHEHDADRFAAAFAARRSAKLTARPGDDPATWVEHARREGRRLALPFMDEIEQHFGTSFDFVEAYTGPAAELACQALSASAFVVQNLIVLADPSPQRDLLLHELTHVVQQGQRRAPSRFGFGTLKVSQPSDTAEVEARGGSSHREVAPPDVIHRAGPGDTSATTGDDDKESRKRIKYFVDLKRQELKKDTFPVPQPDGTKLWAYSKGEQGHKYKQASPHPWSLDAYTGVLNNSPPELKLRKSITTYGRDLAEMLKPMNAEMYRVTRVSDRTYAFIMDGPWTERITDLRPEARKATNPEEQFEAYFAAVKALMKAGRLKGFKYKDYDQSTCTYSEKDAEDYRHAMTDAIAAEYAAEGNLGWHAFYDEVMVKRLFPAKYNGVQGSIFEKLVKLTCGLTLEPNRPLFVNPKGQKLLTKEPRIGDAAFFGKRGNVILDDKAAEAGIDHQQCREYAFITDPKDPIPGYFKGEDPEKAQHKYLAVVYTVPSKAIANKVKTQIDNLFPSKGEREKIWRRFHVTPDPAGLRHFLLKFNPTIRLQSEDTGQPTYTFTNPPTMTPGVTIKTATITTDKTSGAITTGTVEMGVNMAGALQSDGVKKRIEPSPGPEGSGTVENKFGNFKSSLDKILGAVTVDAKLIEGGIEASIALQPGAAKIPQFNVDGATLTAKYVGGVLTVNGQVGLTHQSNKISGKVKVSWSGGQWAFDGQATLAAGMIEGLGKTTLGVKYEEGKTKIYAQEASYKRQFGAVTVSGSVYNLVYGVDDGQFSGSANLDADLGMFGKAKAEATLEGSKLKSASFSYDSPELKYPPESKGNPAFKGTVSGTLTYNEGKFSGAITGKANLNIPMLKQAAGEEGVGLDVDAHVNADGSYGGTIKTSTPLSFGKHLQVPSVSCTIKDNGSVEGAFELKVVKIKYLKEASLKCKVTKGGIEIDDAKIEVPFGAEGKDKFWGMVSVGYNTKTGLQIGGKLNYEIKKGMVATGELKYSTKTHEVSLKMTVSEITLFDSKVKKTLFEAEKKIPIISVYALGIYIDIGFKLGFDFNFKLGLKPTVDFDGLSLETFEFKKIAAQLELLGEISAKLTGEPRLGLGIFALHPSILRGGGGIKVPIVGEAKIKPTGKLSVSYSPEGKVEGDAKVGMNMTFGITGSVKPYADFSVLDGLWNRSWEGDALTQFEILKPKELFNFVLDLGGDLTKKEAPELPAQNAAKEPTKPAADKVLPEKKSAPQTKSGPASARTAEGPTTPPQESGNEGPFSLAALAPLLEKLPGAATVKKILKKAGEVWDRIKGFFGRIVKAFKSLFAGLVNQLEEILDGFAKEGLGYVPKLVRKLVGDTVYELIDPLVKHLSKSGNALLELFETDPPSSAGGYMPWVWRVAQKVFDLGASTLTGFISAIHQMFEKALSVTQKLITKAVKDGWIGVKRHHYYVWPGVVNCVVASEFKLTIPGVINLGHQPPSVGGVAVAYGLYTFLENAGVSPTYRGWNEKAREPYNDRWTGAGARG